MERKRRKKKKKRKRKKKKKAKKRAAAAAALDPDSAEAIGELNWRESKKLTGKGSKCLMPLNPDGTVQLPKHNHNHSHPSSVKDIHPVYPGVSNTPVNDVITHSHMHPHEMDKMHLLEQFASRRQKKKKEKKT